MKKITKITIVALAAIAILFFFLWNDAVNDTRILDNQLKEKELQLIEAETAAIISQKQAEKHKKIAYGVGLERDKLKNDIEKNKKNRPKRQIFPEVCKGITDIEKNPLISRAMGAKSSANDTTNTLVLLCMQIASERKYSDFLNLENEKLNRIIVLGDEVILELDLTVDSLEKSNSDYQAALLASKGITDIWKKKAKKGWLKGFLAGGSVVIGGVVLYSIGKAIANIFR